MGSRRSGFLVGSTYPPMIQALYPRGRSTQAPLERQPASWTHLTHFIDLGFPQKISIGFEAAPEIVIGFQNGHRFSMMIRVDAYASICPQSRSLPKEVRFSVNRHRPSVGHPDLIRFYQAIGASIFVPSYVVGIASLRCLLQPCYHVLRPPQ